jgi:hypothetical protein
MIASSRSIRRPREIKLDTLPQLKEAIALYCSFGFQPLAPYADHPYEGHALLRQNTLAERHSHSMVPGGFDVMS